MFGLVTMEKTDSSTALVNITPRVYLLGFSCTADLKMNSLKPESHSR